MGRTARHRVLYPLPPTERKGGRPSQYGERAPTPAQWLGRRDGWRTARLTVRGRVREVSFRVEGPFLREGVPHHPVFLMVVRGRDRRVGQGKRRRGAPVFLVVSAVGREGEWHLPLPVETLLAWAWQRWELEVAHRELKSGFGVGEKQCWNVRSAISSVQWGVWVYGVAMLAGYRTWGVCGGVAPPGRWRRGVRRWSWSCLLRGLRGSLWVCEEFRSVWTGMGCSWRKKRVWVAGLRNAVLGSRRL